MCRPASVPGPLWPWGRAGPLLPRRSFKWEVVTVEDPGANAFVLPGGVRAASHTVTYVPRLAAAHAHSRSPCWAENPRTRPCTAALPCPSTATQPFPLAAPARPPPSLPQKVVVYTGLVRLMGGRADLLATVLGHEVAHVLARHSAEKVGGTTCDYRACGG
jgi:Zn-dependent protease with chaperone function